MRLSQTKLGLDRPIKWKDKSLVYCLCYFSIRLDSPILARIEISIWKACKVVFTSIVILWTIFVLKKICDTVVDKLTFRYSATYCYNDWAEKPEYFPIMFIVNFLLPLFSGTYETCNNLP